MISTVYVLIMIFGANTSQSGIAVVQQEFTTYELCRDARLVIAKAHDDRSMPLRSQGCYKK